MTLLEFDGEIFDPWTLSVFQTGEWRDIGERHTQPVWWKNRTASSLFGRHCFSEGRIDRVIECIYFNCNVAAMEQRVLGLFQVPVYYVFCYVIIFNLLLLMTSQSSYLLTYPTIFKIYFF